MEWFCTDRERSAMKSREARLTSVFRIMAALTAAVFIVLCLLIRTENMKTMHWVLITVTAVLGWICIILYITGVRETRTQLGHLDMLREGEPEIREGILTVTETIASAGESRTQSASVRPALLRKAAALLPILGIWALAAVFFSSYVFYQVTDTDPAHKITIYMDGEVADETELAARMEKKLGAPVRYAMFGSEALKTADLYIVPDSDKDQYTDWFAQGEESFPVHEPGGISVAGTWFQYDSGDTYRLYIGAGSPHLEDGMARRAAELLMTMETEKEGI